MVNYLQDCYKNTPIGMIPEIINHNNEAISDEFDWIYDASMNRLTKSVYAPAGSIKAHSGEFVNLTCEYLTIKNTNTLKTYIEDVIDDIIDENVGKHNTLEGRFSTENESKYIDSKYCHDAASIVFDDSSTVYDVLDNFNNGNIKIKYGEEIYTAEQIASLIRWKKSLIINPITITDKEGKIITYNVLCEQ